MGRNQLPRAEGAANLEGEALAVMAQAAAEPPPAARTRIDPVLGEDGQPLEINPPCAGRWLRHVDGGLEPADADTAAAAGLAFTEPKE